MKIKKTLAVLLSAAMLAGGLSGCSKPAADNKAYSANTAKDTEAPKADGGITITMVESLTSPERTKLLRSMADKYEADHSDVKINIISPAQESADAKIAQMMQGGEKIDIIEIRDHTLRTYVTNNWLVNMQPYIDNWDEKDTLSGAAEAAMRICDGLPYYMPF